jgi:hypothetical protein
MCLLQQNEILRGSFFGKKSSFSATATRFRFSSNEMASLKLFKEFVEKKVSEQKVLSSRAKSLKILQFFDTKFCRRRWKRGF